MRLAGADCSWPADMGTFPDPRCPYFMVTPLQLRPRVLAVLVLAAAALCRTPGPAQAASAALSSSDLDFLARVTYAPTTSTVADYRRAGQRGFIREQLDGVGELPPAVQQQVDALEISHRDGAALLTEAAAEQKRIGTMPEGEEREAARKALNDHANSLLNETQKRELLRALYSPAQLREQLVCSGSISSASTRARRTAACSQATTWSRRCARMRWASSAIWCWRR